MSNARWSKASAIRWAVAQVALVVLGACNSAHLRPRVIPPHSERFFLAVVDPAAVGACGWKLQDVALQRDHALYTFARVGAPSRAVVALTQPDLCADPVGPAGRDFCVAVVEAAAATDCGDGFLAATLRRGVLTNHERFAWADAKMEGHEEPSRWALVQLGAMGLLLGVLLVGGAGCAVMAARRSLGRAEVAALGLCFAVALGIRLWCAPFPGDIILTLDQGFDVRGGYWWGAGFGAALRGLFLVFPASFGTVVRMNEVIGALAIVPLFGFVWLAFEDRLAALAAAALLACHPISARFAASDSAHVMLTFCFLAAAAFAVQWFRQGGWAPLLQACGWLALAANVRREAIIYVLPAAAVVIVAVARPGGRRRLPALAVGTLLVGALIIEPVWLVLAQHRAAGEVLHLRGLWQNPFFLSPFSSKAVVALAYLGLVAWLAAPKRRAAAVLWGLTIAVIAVPTWYQWAQPDDEMRHRHALPLLAAFLVLAGGGLAFIVRQGVRLWRREARGRSPLVVTPPSAVALFSVLGVALVASIPGARLLRRSWTHQLELDFVRQHLGDIPSGCTVVFHSHTPCTAGLQLTPRLSLEWRRRHAWVSLTDFLTQNPRAGPASAPLGACTVFYRSASCQARSKTGANGHGDGAWTILPECAAMAERFELEPIAETDLPAMPYVGERYTRDPVRVGFYRVRAGRAAAATPP